MKVTVSAPGLNASADTEGGGSAAQSSEADEIELPEGATVGDVLAQMGIDAYSPEMVLVNGDQTDTETVLKDGDAVALGGPMGGM